MIKAFMAETLKSAAPTNPIHITTVHFQIQYSTGCVNAPIALVPFSGPTLLRKFKNGIPHNSSTSTVKKKKNLLLSKTTKGINNYFSPTFLLQSANNSWTTFNIRSTQYDCGLSTGRLP
jgi:hypothetical protein